MEGFPLSQLMSYWRTDGADLFPNMARVASVLLSVPASSAVVEKDFNTTGRLVSENRSKMDAAYAEMVLFLHSNESYIPDVVPKLSAGQMTAAIPQRLSSPGMSSDLSSG